MALTTYLAFFDSLLGHILNNRSGGNSTTECEAEVHQKLQPKKKKKKKNIYQNHITPQTDDSYKVKMRSLGDRLLYENSASPAN